MQPRLYFGKILITNRHIAKISCMWLLMVDQNEKIVSQSNNFYSLVKTKPQIPTFCYQMLFMGNKDCEPGQTSIFQRLVLNTIHSLVQSKVKQSILNEAKCKIANVNDLSLSIPLCQKCPEVTNSNLIITYILFHTTT